MSVFNVITLFGGLAMFLYGMRLMGDGLKASSGSTLKKAMEKVTNNPVKAFLLGLVLTAIIQSSTATIVITSGLVGAGIITLRQSLGIVIGANVGTTVTGQIIRLLDLNSSSTAWLQMFKPSTLAPVALIIGIVFIMFLKTRNSNTIGSIAIGFGILFSGLMNMTGSVDALSESGVFEQLFTSLSASPVLGYACGAGVAFILQSSSATIGILQALSASGGLTFKAIYAVIVGVYLGDCVTTAIVCYIGAKDDAKRVGIVNILFNFCKSVVVLAGVTVAHKLGLIDKLWETTVNSGIIANTNSVFNIVCAIVLLPLVNVFEKLSLKLVKDDAVPASKFDSTVSALSQNLFRSPVLALNECHEVLKTMLDVAKSNIGSALTLLTDYNPAVADEVLENEDGVDLMTDKVSEYLVALSPNIKDDELTSVFDEYYKDAGEFERLSDHSVNIVEIAQNLVKNNMSFSQPAREELVVISELIGRILDCSIKAFVDSDVEAARAIEPLEEVVDDMTNTLRDNHITRLKDGRCSIITGTEYLKLLTDIERISDICSNIGIATVARAEPELAKDAHLYISRLHAGNDETFNAKYNEAHDYYFSRLAKIQY